MVDLTMDIYNEGAKQRIIRRKLEDQGYTFDKDGVMQSPKKEQGSKHKEGKLRYDLIPVNPLEELAKTYTIGLKDHKEGSWKDYTPEENYSAMMRHIQAYRKGEIYDKKDGQHHMGAASFYCFNFMYHDLK